MFVFLSSGVLWLSLFSEFMYISLLAMGFLMMWTELLLLCLNKEMCALKINAFAAICTVLSGEVLCWVNFTFLIQSCCNHELQFSGKAVGMHKDCSTSTVCLLNPSYGTKNRYTV